MKNRIFSLLLCFLVMVAAALSVNKSLFGHRFDAGAPVTEQKDSVSAVTRLPDGGVAVNTTGLSDVSGYGGPVPLQIIIKDDKVARVEALPNSETPSFFERASALLAGYEGKSVKEAAAMKPDAVSGATYSSMALKANMEAGLDSYLHTSSGGEGESIPWKMWVALAVTLAACILPLFIKNKIYNNVQMIVNVAVLGFWCGQFLDYAVMVKMLSSGVSLPLGLTALVMLVAAFIFPLFGHPQHYCNHICPFGSAQMLVAKLCHYKIKIGRKTLKGLDWARKIFWAVLMLLLWTDVWAEWMDYDLFQAFIVESAPVGIIITASLFVALSAVVARPYCRFVCPTGSLFKRSENIG